MHADGTFINEWSLPGSAQEGIVLDPDTDNLFITEDTGRVMLYSPFPTIPEPATLGLLIIGGLALLQPRS